MLNVKLVLFSEFFPFLADDSKLEFPCYWVYTWWNILSLFSCKSISCVIYYHGMCLYT